MSDNEEEIRYSGRKRHGMEFIKTQKIELEKSIPFFDKLKSITISIDEIISEYNAIKPKSKTKKKRK